MGTRIVAHLSPRGHGYLADCVHYRTSDFRTYAAGRYYFYFAHLSFQILVFFMYTIEEILLTANKINYNRQFNLSKNASKLIKFSKRYSTF